MVESGLAVGQLAVHPQAGGVGKIGEIDGLRVRLDLFESAAEPVAEQFWVPAREVRRCLLGRQTRVYWHDAFLGLWRAGRIVGGGPEVYFVRPPNSDTDIRKEEIDLWVRWEHPIKDPLQVLLAAAQESPFFRDARLPALRNFAAQRAACASATSIISSGVQIHPHQIHVALRVLSDPVQRYLLADEVGLGKTIEAGFVIRQRFLDDPVAKVVVVAPDALRRQWLEELRNRFFVDDFPGKLTIAAHEDPQKWARCLDYDLVVVDEAHLLAGTGNPALSPYAPLRDLCHSVPSLLLLSATPVLQRELTHLGLMHLLDPGLYRWQDLEGFRQRLTVRRQLAKAVYAVDPGFPFLLPSTIDQIRDILPADPRFEDLARQITAMLTDAGDVAPSADEAGLAAAVAALRGHISETYRLDRRVIRNRRDAVVGAALDDEGVLVPFEVTGRRRPCLIGVDSLEHALGRGALERWQVAVRDDLIDRAADPTAYGPVLSVLASRTCGPVEDLRFTLRWRVERHERDGELAGLSAEERELLSVPPVLPGEREVLRVLEESDLDDGLGEIVVKLAPALRARHAVVFAGPGTLAPVVARALGDSYPAATILEHSRGAGAEASEAAVTAWRRDGGLLICDASAENGRNFQQADTVVHLRLPGNPNALEQRVGRVDRYGTGQAAQQVILGDLDVTSLTAGWRTLLLDGYGVFDRSISALQDPVDRDLDRVWCSAVTDGVAGLLALRGAIASSLSDELRAVAQMDVLESSYEATASAMRDPTLDLARLEVDPQAIGDPLVHLLTGVDAFRFHARRNADRSLTIQLGTSHPLLSLQLLARLVRVPPASRTAFVDRWQALKAGGRLFRLGNPFVDAVVGLLQLDDRGQASAQWRADPAWGRDPLPYFGFDFLVEADLTSALAIAGDFRAPEAPLRRRADRALAPFLRRVWIPADGVAAIQEESLVHWLDAPYRHTPRDVNLNPKRIGALHDLFGGPGPFARTAIAAEQAARSELVRVTDLPDLCQASSDALRQEAAVLAAQAGARHAAGHLVADDDSLSRDRDLGEALAAGIDRPRVRLVAVTCLVRSRLPWSAHAAA